MLALLVGRRELTFARRLLVVALLVGLVAIVPAPARAALGGSVRVLVPSSRYTASPSLAVSAGGASLVSWFGGPAPIVSAEPLPAHHHHHVGEKLFAASGTLGHGFGSSVLLAEPASTAGDAPQGPLTALIGSGVGYVAWRSEQSGSIMVAVEHAGRFGRARVLLPAYDQRSRSLPLRVARRVDRRSRPARRSKYERNDPDRQRLARPCRDDPADRTQPVGGSPVKRTRGGRFGERQWRRRFRSERR